MSNLLPPVLERFTAISILGVATLLVAAHTLLAGAGAQRVTRSARYRVGMPILVGGLLSAWLATAMVMADGADFPLWREELRRPVSLVISLLPVIGGVLLLFVSRNVRALYEAMPSDWLIRIQLYRVLGVMFLFPFLYYGVVPATFAVPAAFGDVLTGALAPIVGHALTRRRRNAHFWAVAWNVFGILDLIVAPTAALLSGANVIAVYPLALVPLFSGPPLGILTHIYSLRNLAVAKADDRTTAPALTSTYGMRST